MALFKLKSIILLAAMCWSYDAIEVQTGPAKNAGLRIDPRKEPIESKEPSPSATEDRGVHTNYGIQPNLNLNDPRVRDLYATGEGQRPYAVDPSGQPIGQPIHPDYQNAIQSNYAAVYPDRYPRRYFAPPPPPGPIHYGRQYLGRRPGYGGYPYQPVETGYPYGYDGLYDPRQGHYRADPYYDLHYGYAPRASPYDLYHYGSENSLYRRSPYHNPRYGQGYRGIDDGYAYSDYGNEYARSPYYIQRGGHYHGLDGAVDGAVPQIYGLPTNGNPSLLPPGRTGQAGYEDQRRYGPDPNGANKDLNLTDKPNNGLSQQDPKYNVAGPPLRVAQVPLGQTRYGVRRRFDRTLNRLYNTQESQLQPTENANPRDIK